MTALAKQSPIVTIETYRETLCEEIGALIVGIQHGEFGVPITLEDQPDLKNIPAVYQKGKGNFWMAMENGQLAGTIALIDVGGGIGVIRKMFVRKESRGTGIAQQLLDTLLDWARVHGFHQLYLGTLEKFQAAIRFYEKNKFTPIALGALPEPVDLIRMKHDCLHYIRTLPL